MFGELMFPIQVPDYRATNSGEVVTMRVPESPVFNGLEPLDMSWFELGADTLPVACRGVYSIGRSLDDVVALADHCDIHAYLKKKEEVKDLSGSPIIEINLG